MPEEAQQPKEPVHSSLEELAKILARCADVTGTPTDYEIPTFAVRILRGKVIDALDFQGNLLGILPAIDIEFHQKDATLEQRLDNSVTLLVHPKTVTKLTALLVNFYDQLKLNPFDFDSESDLQDAIMARSEEVLRERLARDKDEQEPRG